MTLRAKPKWFSQIVCTTKSETKWLNLCNIMTSSDNRTIILGIHDVPGGSDYARQRPLHYHDVDLFIICFSVDEESSLQSAVTKWAQEVRQRCPGKTFRHYIELQ